MVELYPPAGGVWTFEEFMELPDIEGARYQVSAGTLYLTRTLADAEARVVEIYGCAGPRYPLPQVIRNRWQWEPVPNGPALGSSLPDLLKECDGTKSMFEGRERRHVVG